MTAYTSDIVITGSRIADGYVDAWLESETDTTATIGWTIGCRQKWAAQYGQEAYAYVDGDYAGYCSGYIWESDKQGNYKNVCSTSGYTTVAKTADARSVPVTVETRVTPIDNVGTVTTDWASKTCYVDIDAIDYEAPYDPTDVSAVRESDNKNIVSWAQDGTGMSGLYPWYGFYILRKTDGGELSRIADVANWEATSYNDTTTSANHFYEYGVQAYGPGGTSEVVLAAGTLYNTPAAPTKITASRLAETKVKLEIENPANTATALDLQRSEDALSWEDIPSVDGSPVTETTDEPGGGTFYYRARNTRGDLASAWSPASNAVVTICAPAAPTLVSPASGSVVSKAQETVTFEHKHNPIDGSGQTAAQYRFSTDKGATYAYYDIEGADEKLAMENSFAVNSEVTWGVRTKGAHEDWGPWSDNRVFFVYQAPSVAFAQPTDGFVVENTPIAIQLQYDDPSGTLASAMLTFSDGSKAVYTRNMGTDTKCVILTKEWTPDNGKVYTLTIAVRSSSTLTASATREISVDFALPQPAGIHVANDPETGYATLVVYVEKAADLEAAKSISIWRESEDGRVLLGENLKAGAGLVDRYAPLNVDYQYTVKSFADSGAANSQEFANKVSTDWSFIYFDGDIARCKWNPQHSHDMSSSAEFVHYMGDTWPTAHMDDFLDETYPVTALVIGRDESRAFRRMMMARKPVVAKLWRGDVFWAVPRLSEKAQQGKAEWWEVSVDLTRVEGDAL